MKTSTTKPAPPVWFLIDATGKTLGRLATEIATILRGKHKVDWSPHQVMSDHVIVINSTKITISGKKSDQKEYIRHSGYFGSLKRLPFARLFAKDPSAVISRAVRGMLPRNRLREEMLRHLHVYEGAEHPHEAQQPSPLPSV